MHEQANERIIESELLSTRREFLATLGAGLFVLIESPWLNGADKKDEKLLEAWLRVDPDGNVTGFTGKVEYGQGTRTGFVQVIAEELTLPMDRVRIVMGDTDLVPFDAGTYASLSTEMMRPRFQRAAARARVLLEQRAARRWDVPVDRTRCERGMILGPGGQSVRIGELVRDTPLTDVLEYEPDPKPSSSYGLVGKDIARIDGLERVTGTAVYGTDFVTADTLHGAVLRPPFWGARLKSLDSSKAEKSPGLVKIVRTGEFAGVVAETEFAAQRAVKLLEPTWEGQADVSNAGVRSQLENACREAEIVHKSGDEGACWAASQLRHESVYETSFVYHAALEPQAAWAKVADNEVWICASVQIPFGIRRQIADLVGLPLEKVHVKVTEIGGAFGRKNHADAPREAVLLSRSVGRPVRVVWSRQEDFAHSTYRPAARMEVRGGLSQEGRLLAWDYCMVSAGGRFSSTRDVQSFYPSDFHCTRFGLIASGVRDGSFRGLGSPIHAFARESFIDELAFAARVDPLTFRLRALGNTMPRLSAVLRAVVAGAAWQPGTTPRGKGVGFGLACCLYRDKTYVAQVAEIHVGDRDADFRVEKVTTAIDCGFVVNPDAVRKQAEGGVTMAASYSLGESIEVRDSMVSNDSFRSYPILRAADTPHVETILVGQSQNPSVGVGEPVTVPVAAALANAYFDATGVRRRSLPLRG